MGTCSTTGPGVPDVAKCIALIKSGTSSSARLTTITRLQTGLKISLCESSVLTESAWRESRLE